MKAIGIKMVELQPMTAKEANDKGYKIGNHSFEEEGYEISNNLFKTKKYA